MTKNNETEELDDDDNFDLDLALTPFNDEWEEFIIKLSTMIRDPKTYEIKDLDSDDSHGVAIHVLRKYFPSFDLDHTLNFFMFHDGYDDIEILMNVEADFDNTLRQMEEEENKRKLKLKRNLRNQKTKLSKLYYLL